MRLGIDLDGVVADFNKGWTDQYERDFGVAIPVEAVTTWSGMVGLTHFPDMPAFWKWARDFGNGSLFRHLETFPEALPTLERLSGDHDIVIITSKPDWAIWDTMAWLSERRLPTREIHIVKMRYPKWKISCDVYLEDAPHQLNALATNRPGATTCRFVRPWNDPVDGVRDVNTWQEFEDLVGGIARPGD